MRPETFFEKFDLLADTPGAVAKMRELVMWSAFSGAFSNEPRDQPMPDEWAIEGAPTLPSIPSSWSWQRGRDTFDVIRGVSYRKSDASDTPVDGSFPILRANNIGRGINFEGLVYVPRDNIRDEQFVRCGDILIAMSSGSRKLVGKAAPIVNDFHGAFGAFCGVIRNKSKVPDDVLARYFESPQYTSWVTAAGRGIGINNLGMGDLDALPIPVPPLAEQQRIVAKVDELMVLCDRLEAQQQERETRHAALARASLARFADSATPANLDLLFHKSYSIPPADLRKFILTLAIQGKLVPQDTEDKPIEERSDNGTAGSAQFFPSPFEVPSTWKWKKLGAIAQIERGGSPRPIKDYLTDDPSGLNWIKISDTSKGGKYVTSTQERIRPEGLSKTRKVYPGDFLLTNSMSFGRPYISKIEGCIHDGWLRIHPPNEATSDYLYWLLSSPYVYDFFSRAAAGAVVQNLNADKVRELPVPLPPLPEQCRIVAKVDELMALVDALEAQLGTARTTGAILVEAVVAELTAGA